VRNTRRLLDQRIEARAHGAGELDLALALGARRARAVRRGIGGLVDRSRRKRGREALVEILRERLELDRERRGLHGGSRQHARHHREDAQHRLVAPAEVLRTVEIVEEERGGGAVPRHRGHVGVAAGEALGLPALELLQPGRRRFGVAAQRLQVREMDLQVGV
jgi:hypothetical protein